MKPARALVLPLLLGAAACDINKAHSPAPVDSLTLVTTVPIPANYGIHDQFVRNGLAFVCAWNSGLLIYDVGNGIKGGSPENPVLVSSLITNVNGVSGGAQVHNAWWFWNPANGQKKYVFIGQEGPGIIGASSQGDIHVVDVSDLEHPVETAFFHLGDVNGKTTGTHNFWVDEAHQVLYAAYYNGGVVAIDVSGDSLVGDLGSRLIATVLPNATGTYVWGVMLSGGYLYASDMVNGFWQLQLQGDSFAVLDGGLNVNDRFTSDLWVRGGAAYTGTWGTRSGVNGNAVKIWHLAASGAPTLVDSIIVPNIGTVSDIEVSPDGKLLLFGAERGNANGIYLYGLSANPQHPFQVAFYPVGTGIHTATFAQIGGRTYVFAAKDPVSPALMIFDVTGLLP